MARHEIERYSDAYYSMVWTGPKGYPENLNSGRCYITGLLGMLQLHGEQDILFADGSSGDGFSFRWCPAWGAPAFNGGTGAFHEIWEYMPRAMGFRGHWDEDFEGGWDEAWAKLKSLLDRDIPVQVATHYSVIRPYGDATSPALALRGTRPGSKYASGHHIVVAGYDEEAGTVTIFEPNDKLPHSRYRCPIDALKLGWTEAAQRTEGHYKAWPQHHPWDGEWSLHDGYGPFCMVWIEPGRDPQWDIAASIRHSFRRNLKILRGEYPKPYNTFGNQWMIPHWETGAPGMVECAKAVREGRLGDIREPDGGTRALFAQGQIPNHGVLGRASAAGYLRRVATELGNRGLDSVAVSTAAGLMQQSSDLFRELRYEMHLPVAAGIFTRIADLELAALAQMEAGWLSVQHITGAQAEVAGRARARAA